MEFGYSIGLIYRSIDIILRVQEEYMTLFLLYVNFIKRRQQFSVC